MAELGPLTPILRRVRRRLRLQRVADVAAWSLLPALVLAAIGVAAQRFANAAWATWPLGLALALPACVAFAAAMRRIPLLHAAYVLDRAHRLDDRVQSALQFAADAEPSDFMLAAVRDAIGRATSLSAAQAAPFRAPRAVRYSVPALTVLAVVRWTPIPVAEVPVAPPQSQRAPSSMLDAETLEAFEAELRALRAQGELSAEADVFAKEYQRILADLASGSIDRDKALQQLAQLEGKLRAAKAGHDAAMADALERMAADLGEGGAGKEVAKAIRAGDLTKASKALEELAAQVEADSMRRREREKLAQALREAGKEQEDEASLLKKQQEQGEASEPSLLQKKRELERLRREQASADQARRKLDELRRELQKAGQPGDAKQAAQALRDAAKKMKELANKGMDAEQQKKLAQQMSQLRQQLQRQQNKSAQGKPQGQPQGQGGQAARMKKFNLQARGKEGEQKGTPIVMKKPGQEGQDGGKPNPGEKKGDAGAPPEGPEQRVLELGGEGEPNAELNIPELQQMQDRSGSGDSDDARSNPNDRLKGKTNDSQLKGVVAKGPARSEVIYGAAEEGFTTTPYSDVYNDYRTHAEDVLERDEIPPGFRFYVRRYFQLIRPREGDGTK